MLKLWINSSQRVAKTRINSNSFRYSCRTNSVKICMGTAWWKFTPLKTPSCCCRCSSSKTWFLLLEKRNFNLICVRRWQRHSAVPTESKLLHHSTVFCLPASRRRKISRARWGRWKCVENARACHTPWLGSFISFSHTTDSDGFSEKEKLKRRWRRSGGKTHHRWNVCGRKSCGSHSRERTYLR